MDVMKAIEVLAVAVAQKIWNQAAVAVVQAVAVVLQLKKMIHP
jgi:hypothetical protein